MSLPDPAADRQFYDGVPLRRLVAFVIDMIVIVALMALVALSGVILGFFTAGLGFVLAILLFFATGFAYRFILISQRSATLGMMALGIELRDRTGEKLDAPTSLVHTAGFYVTLMFPFLMVIGWLLMLTSPYRRLGHDILPGTTAINRPL
ncbi:MAG: RDD family protein [Pseudomonadota bacterium]